MEKVPKMREDREPGEGRVYNASGSQRCRCKECGIYYTIAPKRHAYPEETRELAIKMYYGGISGRGVGKILGINKSNVMNWIKKDQSREK